MRRRLPWLVGGLLGLITLGVLGALAVPWPDVVRAVAINRIESATGRPATIESLALDLRKGTVSVRGVRIADRDGGTLATIGQLDARLRLRSLLAGHVHLRSLAIKDSTVRVVRLSAHAFNISDLGKRQGGGTRLGVTVDRFDLIDGAVLLEDRSLDPTRVWKSENIRISAGNISTARDDGWAEGSSTINGAPVSLRIDELRLVPVHLRAVVRAQEVDLALARVYLPADAPVVLDRGRLDTTMTVVHDARAGVRVDVDGQIVDAAVIRRQQRDPFLVAPAVRLTVRDFTVGPDGALAVGRVELAGATTLVNGDASPPARFELPQVTLQAEGLAWPVRGPAHVELTSSVPGGGQLAVQGQIRPQPPTAEGTVRLTRVNLAPWGRYAAPGLQVTGTAEIALAVKAALGSAITANAKGTARATGVTVTDAGRRLVAVDQAEVSDLELQWPSRLTVGRVRLARPSATLERDQSGRVGVPGMPAPAGPADGATSGTSTLGRSAPDKATAGKPAPDKSTPRSSPLTVAVGEVGIEDGAVTWRDLAVKPATTLRMTGIRAVARQATWPLSGAVPVEFRAATPEGGTIEIQGRIGVDPMTADVQVKAQRVAVGPYAAYLPLGRPARGYADARLSAMVSSTSGIQARVQGTAGLSRVFVADGNRRVLSAERMEARGLDVDWPGRISVDRVMLREPWVLVERDEHGVFTLRSMLLGSPAANGAGAPTSPTSSTGATAPSGAAGSTRLAPAIRVGELIIQDGGARVVDRAVPSPYAEDVSRLQAHVRDLATASDKPARVEVKATVGPAGAISARGTVSGLDSPLSLDVSGDVRDLAVPRLNPYLQHFVGWNARQGTLSTSITCRVSGDDLKAKTDFRLARLQVAPAGAQDAARQRIGLPLGLVVALLKDRKGDIHLSLPLGGRLHDPRFDFGDAAWGAVRQVAVHTIALPVSWVGRLHVGADSKIQDVEIDPLDFNVGAAKIAAEAQARAERLATFMQTLPDVRLVVTPLISVGDIEALKIRVITARIQSTAAERKVSELEAARLLFSQQFPRHQAPGEVDEIIDALREVEEPPATEAGTLAKERFQAVRSVLKDAGVAGDRLVLSKATGALETQQAGRVEFSLTDHGKPKRTLADLLRALVEALQRRLAANRG